MSNTTLITRSRPEYKGKRDAIGGVRLDAILTSRPDGNRGGLRAEDLALLELVDGQRTVEEILHLSRMSPFVVMRKLRSLYERELIDSDITPTSKPMLPEKTRDLTAAVPEVI